MADIRAQLGETPKSDLPCLGEKIRNSEPSSLIRLIAHYASPLFLALLMIVFGILEPRFLTADNLLNVLREVSIYGLRALGTIFVILTAGTDLSVGSIIALAGLAAAAVAKGGFESRFAIAEDSEYGWAAAALTAIAIAIGVAAGAAQGFAISS